MICNEEDADGRARVTTEEERVLHVSEYTIKKSKHNACL